VGEQAELVALREVRDAFRHFRLDRMASVEKLTQEFTQIEGRTLQDYLDKESRS